ncbi:hypothetical protein K470DRAFT_105044 [Piedraia hortae CBS 480.64]|uniref:Secreted protein n=1 Tax=Piedraia hortae CBS 480.64 TaxID=1314780 RepID=A0A6A7C7W8_9PEZI|nr:hypothetical protein K470DRAFT_105044 [Piedraia hortae CBS 480.64]
MRLQPTFLSWKVTSAFHLLSLLGSYTNTNGYPCLNPSVNHVCSHHDHHLRASCTFSFNRYAKCWYMMECVHGDLAQRHVQYGHGEWKQEQYP